MLFRSPSDFLISCVPSVEGTLLGDKAVSAVFDNTKIKRFVPGFECTIPFARGAEELVEFYRANPDFEAVNAKVDQLMDRLAQQFAV